MSLVPFVAAEQIPALIGTVAGTAYKNKDNILALTHGIQTLRNTIRGRSQSRKRARSMPRAVSRGRSRTRDRISKSERVAKACGEPPNRNTHKKCQVASNTLPAKQTRTLYDTKLVDLLKQSTGEEIDRRDRNMAHILGFDLNFQIAGISGSPMTFSYAVIAAKNTNATAVSTNQFFRDFGSSRTQDFGTGMNSLQLAQYPINTDNWRVLGKWNVKIGGQNDTTGSSPEVNIRRKVPFNRQITYDSTSQLPRTQVFVVYWMDQFGKVAGGQPVNSATVLQSHVTFFSDLPAKYKQFSMTHS